MPETPLIVMKRGGGDNADSKMMKQMMMMQMMQGAMGTLSKTLTDYQQETKEKQLNAIEAVISGKMSREDAEKVFGTKIPGGIQAGEEALANKATANLKARAARGETLSEQESALAGSTDKPLPASSQALEGRKIDVQKAGVDVQEKDVAMRPAEIAGRQKVAETESAGRAEAERIASARETARQEFEAKMTRRAEREKAYERKRETKWKLLDAKESRKAETYKTELQFKTASYKSALEFAKEMEINPELEKLANLSKDDKMDEDMRNAYKANLMNVILERHPEMRPFFEQKAGSKHFFGWFDTFVRSALDERDTMRRSQMDRPLGDSATFSTNPTPQQPLTGGALPVPGAVGAPVPMRGGGPGVTPTTTPPATSTSGVKTTDDLRREMQGMQR